MNVRRLFVIGIAFVAMSMFGLVQAGFTIGDGKTPVYTTDGTSTPDGATFEVAGNKLDFTVEKGSSGDGTKMEMEIGGCTFEVGYMDLGTGSVGIGGNPVDLANVGTASASGSGVTYGSDNTPGTCTGSSINFAKVDDTKSSVVVKFDYPKKDFPPLKFTFTNAKKYAPKKNEEAMGAETITGIIGGAVVSFIVAVVAAVGFTWCCCWCEGCCFNDSKKCSKWNKKKQQRIKAEKGGENQEKEKAKEGDAKDGNTAKPDDGAPITESTKQPPPGSVVQGQFNETNQSPNKGVAAANPAGVNAGGQVQI